MLKNQLWISPIWRFILCWTLCTLLLQRYWPTFIYDRTQLFSQLWRLWTGQWVHLGWIHAILNLIALCCLPLVLVQSRCKDLLLLLVVLPPLLSMLLYVFHPELQYYAGLSGILHGIYVALAIVHLRVQKEQKIAAILLFGIVAKIAYEQWRGDSQTAALIGFPVIIDAHLYGACIGALMGSLMWLYWKCK